MKRVLMIAYHFPPLAGSSGIQRTLRFVQHLPAFGWEPIVLTAHPRAYDQTSADLVGEVPPGVHVERAFAVDAARHLAIGGRYPSFLARPDRWMTWRFGAVPAGMRLIRKYRPQAIWSTYPIATAHVIGDILRRRSALPWIADFRDPMAQDGYPEDPRIWRSFKAIEETAVRRARFSVFTTPGAAREYKRRYPDAAQRIVVIENGFDEESFAGLAAAGDAYEPLNAGAVTVLHSGIVYPSERDPTVSVRGDCTIGRRAPTPPRQVQDSIPCRRARRIAANADTAARSRGLRGALAADRLPRCTRGDGPSRCTPGTAGCQLQRANPREDLRVLANRTAHSGAD